MFFRPPWCETFSASISKRSSPRDAASFPIDLRMSPANASPASRQRRAVVLRQHREAAAVRFGRVRLEGAAPTAPRCPSPLREGRRRRRPRPGPRSSAPALARHEPRLPDLLRPRAAQIEEPPGAGSQQGHRHAAGQLDNRQVVAREPRRPGRRRRRSTAAPASRCRNDSSSPCFGPSSPGSSAGRCFQALNQTSPMVRCSTGSRRSAQQAGDVVDVDVRDDDQVDVPLLRRQGNELAGQLPLGARDAAVDDHGCGAAGSPYSIHRQSPRRRRRQHRDSSQ